MGSVMALVLAAASRNLLVQLDNPGKGQLRSMRVRASNASQGVQIWTAIAQLAVRNAERDNSLREAA